MTPAYPLPLGPFNPDGKPMTTNAREEAAARAMAAAFDYPWEPMPEKGREEMRKNARAVLAAADGVAPAQGVSDEQIDALTPGVEPGSRVCRDFTREQVRDTVRAALAAFGAVPDGYALVPVEPTKAMLLAAAMVDVGPDDDGVHRLEPWLTALWAAMLQAAQRREGGSNG